MKFILASKYNINLKNKDINYIKKVEKLMIKYQKIFIF